MIIYKTPSEIELIRQSCLLVSSTLAKVAESLKPGMNGLELDQIAEEHIRNNGGVPGFKNYNGFPNTLCISVNSCVVHGIPSDKPFESSDIVSVDCGVFMNGYFGDAAYTFAFNDVTSDVERLLLNTKKSLALGIAQAVEGNRLGDIGYAIQNYTERECNYGVVRELVGHGLGQNLHEAPEVPNYGSRGRGVKLKSGLVIAIEPMINLGTRKVKQDKDGWSVLTKDGKASAHFEHTLAVGSKGADVLSDHNIIELAIKNNINIKDI